ncbi:MAG: CBS domain-containing protein [Hymenobacter sp.]
MLDAAGGRWPASSPTATCAGCSAASADLEQLRARDILTPHPATIDVDDFAAEALARMQQRNITQLVVTDHEQIRRLHSPARPAAGRLGVERVPRSSLRSPHDC